MRVFTRFGWILLLLFCSLKTDAQQLNTKRSMTNVPESDRYFGQNAPGSEPAIFAPGFISMTGRNENVVTFSPDGSQCFFSTGSWPNRIIMFTEYKNNNWTTPVISAFSANQSADEPSFSTDGTRVYFYTYPPGSSNNSDICYSQKEDTVWNNPINLGSSLNSSADEYHPCFVSDSSVYFVSSNGRICRSQYSDGIYQSRVILPAIINDGLASSYLDAYAAPDESYLIFNSKRSGGYGNYDLYISYKKNNGSWTNPKNLGNKINTSADELDGDITPDGLYMTFSRSSSDIYWVSAKFIDSLKYTNFLPYLVKTIPNQSATKDAPFNYQIPDSTFIDDDGNNTLHFRAAMSNGNLLPTWLSFDTVKAEFSGIPDTAVIYNIVVTAIDTAGAYVSSSAFKITVSDPPENVNEEKGNYPKVTSLYQNYPNPFNPSTIIRFYLSNPSKVNLCVYNLLGQEIRTIYCGYQHAGEHTFTWDGADDSNLLVSSGIYFYQLKAGNIILHKKMVLMR